VHVRNTTGGRSSLFPDRLIKIIALKVLNYTYWLTCILLSCIVALPAGVRAAPGFRLDEDNRYRIGLGVSRVEFDTKLKITDKQLDLPIFIDGEGTLGLPEVSNVNTIYAGIRIGEKHSLWAAYFSVERENSFTVSDVDLGDLLVVDASVSLRDETKFLNLDYGYNLFRDYRSSVDVLLGIYLLDLKYVFEARGQYQFDGISDSGTFRQEAQAIAPIPDIGLHVDFAFTPRWSIGARFAMIRGSYGEISASAYRTSVRAKYLISRNFAADLGVSYFNADVTIDEDANKIEVGYGFNGLYAGIHWEL
jgi:hypothetical protein